MTRKIGFRKSLRDTLIENNKASAWYAAMAEKPAVNLAPIPPKREYTRSGERGETDVIVDVIKLLKDHPRILYALRMNSGSAEYTGKDGRLAPVWFHKWVRKPEKIRMSDFYGATTDARILAVECKRPGWKKPTDDRELEQAAFLEIVRKNGGIALFCTDASQVIEALRQS